MANETKKISDTAAKIAKSTDGRRHKKAMHDRKSKTELAVLNEGRSNNISDLMAGTIGNYAFPGGDQPSVHVTVENRSKDADKPFIIAEVIDVQDGHRLQQNGVVGIFLPVYTLGKPEWKSANEILRIQTAQNKIHDYLIGIAQKETPAHAKDSSEAEQRFAEYQKRYAAAEAAAVPDFINGVHGDYSIKGVVLRVGHHPKYNNGCFITLVRGGSMLKQTEVSKGTFVGFKTMLYGDPVAEAAEGKHLESVTKLLAFLREKFSAEIAERKAKDAIWEKAEAQKAEAENQKAIASQHNPSGDEIVVFKHGSYSADDYLDQAPKRFKPVSFDEHLERMLSCPFGV